MKKTFFIIIASINLYNCSPQLNELNIYVNDQGKVLIQNELTEINRLKTKIDSLTNNLSVEEKNNLSFSIQASKESKVSSLIEIRDIIKLFKSENSPKNY